MSSGDKLCSLTQDIISKPYIVNLTGRSYSFDAIMKAISTTLLVGNNLRLEDLLLTPDVLPVLILYRNNTLWNYASCDLQIVSPSRVEFSMANIKDQGYDKERILGRNIPQMSKIIEEACPEIREETWNPRTIGKKYREFRRITEAYEDSPFFIIEDLLITSITIQGALKCAGKLYIFQNVLFTKCEFKGIDFYDVALKNCELRDCRIWLEDGMKFRGFNNVHFFQCTFFNKKLRCPVNNVEREKNWKELIRDLISDTKYIHDCEVRP